MSDRTARRPRRSRDPWDVIKGLLTLVVFVACVVTVVIAQQTTSWTSLGIMLVALAVLILLLARYNRKFR